MADITKVKDRIKKLLALGQSPNENEARDAILLARKLMNRYKLSDADVEAKKNTLSSQECGISWTSDSGNIWMTTLCKTISDNYCCVSAWRHDHGCRTYRLVLTGMEDDLQVCKAVIEYAVGFIEGRIKVLQRKLRNGNNKSIGHSYAEGFIAGLQMAFEEQNEQEVQENHNWALVIQKPEEVQKYEESLGSRSVKTKKSDFDPLAYLKGQNDGKNFSANKVLAQEA